MALITLRDISLSFGGPPLLAGVDFSVERGERVCLLGRNGEGKSTLLRVIAGELNPDDGELAIQQGVRINRLTQEVPEGLTGSVFEVVSGGLGELGDLVRRFHRISSTLDTASETKRLAELAGVQQELEAAGGWQLEQRIETVLSRLALPPDTAFENLSGGLKRRVLLGRALVSEPDLLLLDEPTNHLDIDAIDWLERFLLGWTGTLLFVTHDRMFLQRIATRIVELDRGCISDWPGDYENFLRRREELQNAEFREHARFDKRLAQEEVWIRQGIKARRTRNEGRVRALERMRDERRQRRERSGTAKLALQEAELSGRLVIEAKGVAYAWEGQPVIRDFSTTILRGDRVGIIGPNGSGKTTLLNLLLGRLQPDRGSVQLGTRLEVAYFDQLRGTLNLEASVRDNVAGGSDQVEVNGRRKHVIGYLQDFLFAPERANQPVAALSGGERNRLLLAKLFARPCNLLVLDEPTNDLDLETLELLEDLLLEYQGTLLLVSHDRAFLNNVVTSTLVLEGEGRVAEYVGGYDDWLRQRPSPAECKPAAPKKERPARPKSKPNKLGFKEQRELESLPKQIESLEQELEEVHGRLADPAFYRSEGSEIAAQRARLQEIEMELGTAYKRWEELESGPG